MNEVLTAAGDAQVAAPAAARVVQARGKPVATLKECVVEIVSDSGEGAQRCGQSFGAIAARMGNGVWTVEIIPAEIQPPARSRTAFTRRRKSWMCGAWSGMTKHGSASR